MDSGSRLSILFCADLSTWRTPVGELSLKLGLFVFQIRSCAPDLAKAIAGLILSSKDSSFQGECFSLLGLQSEGVGGEIVEDCIEEKIISVIEMNDRKSNQKSELAPFLFENDSLQVLEFQEEEYEEGDDGPFSPLDI